MAANPLNARLPLLMTVLVAGCGGVSEEALLPEQMFMTPVLRWDDLAPRPDPGRMQFVMHPDGHPVIRLERQFIILSLREAEEPRWIPLDEPSRVDDVAWMRDGTLLLISGAALGTNDTEGFHPLISLPEEGMRVLPAAYDRCYLYGGTSEPQRRQLYVYRRGGTLLPLIEAQGAIDAVTGNGEVTFLAVGREIYVVGADRAVRMVYRAQHPVTGLAVGPESSLLYTTAAGVGFVREPGSGFLFLRGRDVRILVRGESLLLLFPDTGVMHCSPVSSLLVMANDLAVTAE